MPRGEIGVCPGVLRTLVTKAMGYHVHAAEYGEHWNFFLTLGVLPVLSALANIPAAVAAAGW